MVSVDAVKHHVYLLYCLANTERQATRLFESVGTDQRPKPPGSRV